MENKKYDAAFKREAIRIVEEHGQKAAVVSKKLDVTDNTLYRWLSKYRKDDVRFRAKVI
jgi:transposase